MIENHCPKGTLPTLSPGCYSRGQAPRENPHLIFLATRLAINQPLLIYYGSRTFPFTPISGESLPRFYQGYYISLELTAYTFAMAHWGPIRFSNMWSPSSVSHTHPRGATHMLERKARRAQWALENAPQQGAAPEPAININILPETRVRQTSCLVGALKQHMEGAWGRESGRKRVPVPGQALADASTSWRPALGTFQRRTSQHT